MNLKHYLIFLIAAVNIGWVSPDTEKLTEIHEVFEKYPELESFVYQYIDACNNLKTKFSGAKLLKEESECDRGLEELINGTEEEKLSAELKFIQIKAARQLITLEWELYSPICKKNEALFTVSNHSNLIVKSIRYNLHITYDVTSPVELNVPVVRSVIVNPGYYRSWCIPPLFKDNKPRYVKPELISVEFI